MCFGSDNWLANNKSCFILLVQTELLHGLDKCPSTILFDAMRIKQDSIPMVDLDERALEFVIFHRLQRQNIQDNNPPKWMLDAKVAAGFAGERTVA